MALRDHLKLSVLIDGKFQAKVTQVDVTFDSGAVRVDTLEGIAGKTPGSKSAEVTGNWAVPIGGLEFDFVSAASNGSYHEIQIPVGAKTFVSQGWFQQAKLGQSTNASTEAGVTFVGEFPELQ